MQADASLIKKTDQCVMCGLCLPHCPTYRVSRHEAESPRGRISLIKAFAQEQLPASPAIQAHLQSCTTCLRCQQVCPANVPYDDIIDAGRDLYRSNLNAGTRYLQYIVASLLSRKWGQKLFSILQPTARGVYKLGLFRHNELIQLAQLQPKQKPVISTVRITSSKNKVTIFPGCTAELFDQETLNNVIEIVNALGFQAKLPHKLLCCSALARHSGITQLAAQQQYDCEQYLHATESSEIITFASGCGQQLDEISDGWNSNHLDIHDWLTKENRFRQLTLKPLAEKILVHTPCSMQVSPHKVEAMLRILRSIPDIAIRTFEDDQGCCGAGGMQLLTPQASNHALLQSMLKTIRKDSADIIVTANIGCALQLRKGIQQAKLDIKVMHPITLLNRQLER